MISSRKLFIGAMLCFALLSCRETEWKGGQIDYLPQTPSSSSTVHSIDAVALSPAERLTLLSLQGLANRKEASLYVYTDNYDDWVLDLYKELGYVIEDFATDDYLELVKIYKDCAKGIVVYDPECAETINLATNVSGVKDLLIASPENLEAVMEASGKKVKLDLRKFGFTGIKDCFDWYKENIFDAQRHDLLGLAPSLGETYDIYRDYFIEFKVPTFWLPGPKDSDYDPEYEQEIIELLAKMPVNIPIIGFWPYGTERGYEEFAGVKMAGEYGKFTLVNTHAGNLSYHSGIKPKCSEFHQTKPRAKEIPQYDPDKKYVALIMNESGDAPCYYLYKGLYARQWSDPQRGEVPISYGISPSIRMLIPAIAEYLYDSQTENDFFFSSISGAGYCYPFEGYGSKTADPDGTIKHYICEMTQKNMEIMDLDMFGLYTHSGGKWSENDRRIADSTLFQLKGVKSIISGMHRIDYTASNAHEMHGDMSVHHTVTFWSYENFVWDDTSLDEKSVDHMENEIRTYGDGQFIQAMFYSWHYGPRRLKILQDRLSKEGYVFVTLREFDELYRESLRYEESRAAASAAL